MFRKGMVHEAFINEDNALEELVNQQTMVRGTWQSKYYRIMNDIGSQGNEMRRATGSTKVLAEMFKNGGDVRVKQMTGLYAMINKGISPRNDKVATHTSF